jgi:hypothetical protein
MMSSSAELRPIITRPTREEKSHHLDDPYITVDVILVFFSTTVRCTSDSILIPSHL